MSETTFQVNEKHYQVFKRLRFEYIFEHSPRHLSEDVWKDVYFRYTQNFELESKLSALELTLTHSHAAQLIYDIFGYDAEIAKRFIMRFNMEFIHELHGLNWSRAQERIKSYFTPKL